MTDIDTLTELFTRFPGIGPRQARRFVYFLLRQDARYRTALVRAIDEIVAHVRQCTRCLRYAPLHAQRPLCDVCADASRVPAQLMVVEKDTDIEQMEKSGAYRGYYFVLGGTLSLTGRKRAIREKELAAYVKKYAADMEEIILALSATPDGEYTTEHLVRNLGTYTSEKNIHVTVLGRGLSTGSELEYADPTTLESALKNRSTLTR